jgi:hypothetical protein
MAKKSGGSGDTGDVVEMLKDLLIVQLGIAGVPQQNIRRIVGCNIVRVNKIVKHLKVSKRKEAD